MKVPSLVSRPGLAALLLVASLPAGGCFADSPLHSLWVIEGEHNSIYLLGSIHVLRESDYPLPEVMDRAYAEAEVLCMEIDIDDLDPSEAISFTLNKGMLPPDRTLEEVLGGKRMDIAQSQAQALGIDLGFFSRAEPWVVALGVIQAQLTKLGLDPDQGIERHFERLAVKDGKEIRGFETVSDQLGVLDGLTLDRQADFLMLSLEDASSMGNELDTLLSAWRRGDSRELAKTLTEEFRDFPDLYAPLIAARNRHWAAQIEKLLHDRDDYLVVVGALHLVGDDSVIELLAAKGIKARQL